jgi:hypothetical protein
MSGYSAGNGSLRRWDVFISHASEDKEAVAIPLTKALERAGLRVWLDRQELRLGDSLRAKIEEGLAKSRFGVVIISPNFLSKDWPQRELDGLSAVENAQKRKVILPVWHNMTQALLAEHAPMLANTLSVDTAEGITTVATQILHVVTAPGSGTPTEEAPTPLRLFNNLLDTGSDEEGIVQFLSAHPSLVQRALGVRDGGLWQQRLGPTVVGFCGFRRKYTTYETHWELVQFCSAGEAPVTGIELSPAVTKRVKELKDVRRWILDHPVEADAIEPNLNPDFRGHVVCGRRDRLTSEDRETLRRLSDELPAVSVRTYDWLIDSAQGAGGDN